MRLEWKNHIIKICIGVWLLLWILDEHFWDEHFIGVLLTSEVGRRPTERVKLTLGHPADQAT